MALAHRPRFVQDSLDLTLTYPAKAWVPSHVSVGGRRRVASGVQSAYRVRADDKLHLVLRVTEEEWPDVRDMLATFQEGEAFTFYPDANDTGTSFEVDLDAPAMGEVIDPQRSGDFPRLFELNITLMGTDGIPPWLAYFGDEDDGS
jgi:hypothetical protein